MWTFGDDEAATSSSTKRPDCPGCGEPDLHGDDFCHECGHAFAHFGSTSEHAGDDEVELPCPMCASGQLVQLEYGRTQCDTCGYTVRDEG